MKRLDLHLDELELLSEPEDGGQGLDGALRVSPLKEEVQERRQGDLDILPGLHGKPDDPGAELIAQVELRHGGPPSGRRRRHRERD